MPQVIVEATVPDADPDEVFARVQDFEAYPRYTDAVREITIEGSDGPGTTSEWSVNFRGGILRWRERDWPDPAARTIGYEQVDGDFERFEGDWRITPTGSDVRVVFTALFDLGIPTLAPIIDPIAERALRDNIQTILRGLLGDGVVFADVPTSDPAGATHV
jgi:ribosome-associated toxin RatA of RatAB toxin-antitoxin module